MACDMLGEAIRLILVTMKKEKKFYMHVARIDEDVIFQRIVRELFKELLLDVMRERMADEDNGNPMLTIGMKMEVDEVLEALKVLLSESLTDMIYHRNGEQKSVNIV